ADGILWQSSDKRIADVDETGKVLATGKTGRVTITARATDGSNKSQSITINALTAVQSVTIDGDLARVAAGGRVQLKATVLPQQATNKQLVWLSSDSKLASVANGTVTVKPNVAGKVIITARSVQNNAIEATRELTIVPMVSSVSVTAPAAYWNLSMEQPFALQAVCNPEFSSQSVSWISSDPSIATVNAMGEVTRAKETYISPKALTFTALATDGSGKKGSVSVTLFDGPTSITIAGSQSVASGMTERYTVSMLPVIAEEKYVLWSVDNSEAASVNAVGVVTAKPVSVKTTVTLSAASTLDYTIIGTKTIEIAPCAISITIEAPTTSIDINNASARTIQLAAVVQPADAAHAVTWKSNAPAVATVNESGLVTGVSAGTVEITATASDGSGVKGKIILLVEKVPYSYAEVAGGMEITGCLTAMENMVIPNAIGGKPVRSIRAGAFQNNTTVKAVTIPAGVTAIAADTFNGCTALTRVVVPDCINVIGERAFAGCTKLAEMTTYAQ
ncbi:MAG: Ig-like domain-containing protein, partial [Clostridia bacterium]